MQTKAILKKGIITIPNTGNAAALFFESISNGHFITLSIERKINQDQTLIEIYFNAPLHTKQGIVEYINLNL